MAHPKCSVPSGLTCACTWEDISIENGNYCEYRTAPSKTWFVSKFGSDTVRHLLKNGFQKYLDDVEKASKDCAAAVKRLLIPGPPVYIKDSNALPIPETDTHIDLIWFSDLDEEVEAKLENCLQGKEREIFWLAQKEALAAMEAAENSGKE